MEKQQRHGALPIIGIVVAVLLVVAAYLYSVNYQQAKELTTLQQAAARHQEEQQKQGRPIDPRDYPTMSPAPTENLQTKNYDSTNGLTFKHPSTWHIRESAGVITLATQASLLENQTVPEDQGKIIIGRATMSWLANVEQLTGTYTTNTKKVSVNGHQVFEITNEDKASGSTWIETYIIPKSNQEPYITITTYPAKSEAATAAYRAVLQSIKVKE